MTVTSSHHEEEHLYPEGETVAHSGGLRRSMLGLGLGNTLEWYDWQVFGLLAATIGVH